MIDNQEPESETRIDIVRYRDEIKSEPRRIEFKGRKGHELYLLMLLPDRVSDGPYPALVWIYGGGWQDDNSWRYPPHLRYSADREAVGIALSYRCVPHSDEPEVKKNGPGIRDCIADCIDGLRHVQTHAREYGIDPGKIVLLGDSAGGHLAAWLALAADDTVGSVAALVNCCGVTDLTDDKWNRHFSHLPDSLDEAKKVSPLYNLKGRSCPVLNLAGDLDPIVPSSETRRFHQACLRKGLPSEYQSWDDIGHAFILTNYHATDFQVTRALRKIDQFLVRNGILRPEDCSVGREQQNLA